MYQGHIQYTQKFLRTMKKLEFFTFFFYKSKPNVFYYAAQISTYFAYFKIFLPTVIKCSKVRKIMESFYHLYKHPVEGHIIKDSVLSQTTQARIFPPWISLRQSCIVLVALSKDSMESASLCMPLHRDCYPEMLAFLVPWICNTFYLVGELEDIHRICVCFSNHSPWGL